MSPPALKCLVFAGLTMLLWVVPSVGTQGQGTRGAPVLHPDGRLVGGGAADVAALAAADAIVADAVTGR